MTLSLILKLENNLKGGGVYFYTKILVI